MFIRSFGCQMNVYDAERMGDIAAGEGYRETHAVEDADLIVLNTCHIRERASEKIFSELGKLRELKDDRRRQGRETTIVVAGCVAQAEGAEILRRQPAVDVVVGPQSYHRLPELLREARRWPGVVAADFPAEDKFDHLPEATPGAIRRRGVAAFVTVQEGCDKFCSFCVVPYTRGAEVSRPVRAVIDEVARLAASGVREVTLLGQNVNAYHGLGDNGGAVGLAGLIRAVAAVPGIARVRYATSHPGDMSEDLIAAHRDIAALAPLSASAGSIRLGPGAEGDEPPPSRRRLSRHRRARARGAAGHRALVRFHRRLSRVRPRPISTRRWRLFAPWVSPRPTRSNIPPAPEPRPPRRLDQIDAATKDRRLAELQALIEEQLQAFNRAGVGRRFEVLFEKPGRREGQIIGRSPYMQAVFAEGPRSLIGVMSPVEIVGVEPHSLRGRVVSPAS